MIELELTLELTRMSSHGSLDTRPDTRLSVWSKEAVKTYKPINAQMRLSLSQGKEDDLWQRQHALRVA